MLEKNLTLEEVEDRNDRLTRLRAGALISLYTRFNDEPMVFRALEKDGSVTVVNSDRRVYAVASAHHNGWDFNSMGVS